MDKGLLNVNILRGMALALLLASFFIEVDYLSRSFFFTGVVITSILFRKKTLQEIKDQSLLKNLSDFFIVVLLGTGICFICLSGSTVKAKVAVGFLLFSFCLLRYVKSRNK